MFCMTLSNDENGVTIRGRQCLDDCIDVLQVSEMFDQHLIQFREFGESVIQGRCHKLASRMNRVEPAIQYWNEMGGRKSL